MPAPNPNAPFSMPMYRDFVARPLRPWIYVVFLVLFQLTGCIYLGSAQNIAGSTGLMTSDVMFIGLCNVVGVNMPFPLLFRFKFRYPNKYLLINAALVIATCNLLALCTTSVPLLALLSFLAGFFKLCGTFECASNIQLWMSPGRDFSIFFPLLYIVVVGDIYLQGWLASVVTYYYSWPMVNVLMVGLMLLVVLAVFLLTKKFYIRKPLPLISVDWLGCVLWSLVMIEIVWLCIYGEYYNWTDGQQWRLMLLALVVTCYFCLQRARHIRHPYISMEPFTYWRLYPLLALFIIAEWLNTTPKVLQNAFTGSILHWGALTLSRLDLVSWVGTLLGCLFTLWWVKGLRQKYTRLLAVGAMGLVAYQVMMYFLVSPELNIEALYLPLVLRAFGYAIYFTALTIYLEELLPFQPFFMGLTLTGFARNGPVEAMMNGAYSFFLRYKVADNIARTAPYAPDQSVLVSIKQLYGVTCLLGCLFLLLVLLYDVQPLRSTMKKIPHWAALGRRMARELRMSRSAD